jgi:hypothetical protein
VTLSAPASDLWDSNYSLSTDPSSLARQSISRSASYNLPPRSSTEGIPHNDGARPNVEESRARSGPNERRKSYHENRYRDGEVDIIPATTKRPAPVRTVSAPQPPMSAPEVNRVTPSADPPSHLSPLGREFIKIKEREYGTCENFMCNNPKIFEEKSADFQLEAVRLAREGKSSMVRTCVQQLLLLRKCSSMSNRDCGMFFYRMREGDQATLTSFLRDFDATLKALKAKSDLEGPIQQERSPQPKPLPPISRELSNVPAEIRHAPEPTRYGSVHSDLPLSMETLTISPRDDQDRFKSHGQAGNRSNVSPMLRQTAARRRSTLNSVDEHPGPDLRSQATSQAGDASIADYSQLDIRGNGGEREELDHRYQKRADAKRFFVIGRVFAMLFHEGAGDVKGGHLSQAVQFKRYNQAVYSHIRRMVVVRERHGYCWCIPINTYNYQGVAKKGLSTQDRKAHCVIYMDNTDPTTDPEEQGLMTKKPIAVTAANAEQKLHHMSRLNFGKVYSVEWNVKVMNVGKVNADSVAAFTGYWRNEVMDF